MTTPLLTGEFIDELAAAMDASGHTYGRVDIDQVPEGIGCEVFTAQNLRDAHATATAAYDREHVTPWLRRTFGELLWAPDRIPTEVHAYRATVDSLSDYDRVARAFARHADPIAVSFRDLMADVVAMVDALGPQVDRSSEGLPLVLLDLSAPHNAGQDARREVLRLAMDRGADTVVVDTSDWTSLWLCADSSLRWRLGVILRLAPDDGALEVERAFALLGARSATGLLVPEGMGELNRSEIETYAADGNVRWIRPTSGLVLIQPSHWALKAWTPQWASSPPT